MHNLPANWTQWAGAIGGAILVGLTGVLPPWVVPAKVGRESSGPGNTDDNLKYLLAFAVGGLLGDVFLHLLPETYQQVRICLFLSFGFCLFCRCLTLEMKGELAELVVQS